MRLLLIVPSRSVSPPFGQTRLRPPVVFPGWYPSELEYTFRVSSLYGIIQVIFPKDSIRQVQDKMNMQNTFGPHLQNLMITSQNSSPAVPHSITGCFATQNIGEVARSDGGVSSKKILVKIIYLMGKIGSFLLPAFSFAEKKQQQSTSHLMCAASQNARRVLRF